MSDYIITATGSLIGDEFLGRMWANSFAVKLFVDGENAQAGLEDTTGEGRVPAHEDLWTFSERQRLYTKELKLRQPLLNKKRRKGR
jgi:hypothetical protein